MTCDSHCAEMCEERLAMRIGLKTIHPRRVTWKKILEHPDMKRSNHFPLFLKKRAKGQRHHLDSWIVI